MTRARREWSELATRRCLSTLLLGNITGFVFEGDGTFTSVVAGTFSFGFFAVATKGTALIALELFSLAKDLVVAERGGEIVIYLDLPLTTALAAFAWTVTDHD